MTYVLTALLLCGCQPLAAHGPIPAETLEIHHYDDGESEYLHSCLDAFLFDGDALPSLTPQGHEVEWKISSGHAAIDNHIIHKTEGAAEYEPVSLSLTCRGQSVSFTGLTLNDPCVAYVIAYFSSEGNDKEQLKLAYTFNGEYWFKLNKDRGILRPSSGTRRLRDPSLVRRPGGGFSLLATQGYDNDSIYVFDSDDLIAYENERLLKLNAGNENTAMSGSEAWAPETFYDPDLHCYVILWSAPSDGGIFYTLSSDLTDCTFPQRLNDPGYPVIDITMTRTSSGWTAIMKDEREPMEEYSQIVRGTGLSWYDLTAFESSLYDRHQVEGPAIMKSLEKDGWYVILDDYTRSAYKLLYTDNIESGSFQELEDSSLMIPLEKPSHCSPLRVTWNELDALIQALGE